MNARVARRNADLRPQLEVFDHPTAPDEELIVLQLLRPRRGADDLAILHLPQLWISIPAGEVFAVEEGDKAVLGGEEGGGDEGEEEATDHGDWRVQGNESESGSSQQRMCRIWQRGSILTSS